MTAPFIPSIEDENGLISTNNLSDVGNAATSLANLGGSSSADLTGHSGDLTIHFTEASIDHNNITNNGTVSHLDIDADVGSGNAHFVSTANPHTVTAGQVGNTAAQWNADQLQGQAVGTGVPNANEVLKFVGGEWTPSSDTGSTTFAGLTDTTFAGLASGELAIYDGVDWKNKILDYVGVEVSQTAHGFTLGTPVYFDTGTTNWELARADASTSLGTHLVGLVRGANNFVAIQMGKLTGLDNVQATSWHFVSPASSGVLTTTEPSTTGQFSNPIGFAPSSGELWVFPYRALKV